MQMKCSLCVLAATLSTRARERELALTTDSPGLWAKHGHSIALKPVTFHYRKEVDPARTAQFGLVAEEVEKVNPDLVAHATDGSAYTVRYEAVNAMLLNEFLKEHRNVAEQQSTIAELKTTED